MVYARECQIGKVYRRHPVCARLSTFTKMNAVVEAYGSVGGSGRKEK